MNYRSIYESPLGQIKIVSDGTYLTHLMLEGQNGYLKEFLDSEEKELPIFEEIKKWLDIYFSGEIPNQELKIKLLGTSFQKEVWDILLKIPYGSIMTYGDIASIIASKRGIPKMSPQGVGQAVSKNPISIIVPCHRVIGSNNRLVGYQGGLTLKEKLLEIERS